MIFNDKNLMNNFGGRTLLSLPVSPEEWSKTLDEVEAKLKEYPEQEKRVFRGWAFLKDSGEVSTLKGKRKPAELEGKQTVEVVIVWKGDGYRIDGSLVNHVRQELNPRTKPTFEGMKDQHRRDFEATLDDLEKSSPVDLFGDKTEEKTSLRNYPQYHAAFSAYSFRGALAKFIGSSSTGAACWRDEGFWRLLKLAFELGKKAKLGELFADDQTFEEWQRVATQKGRGGAQQASGKLYAEGVRLSEPGSSWQDVMQVLEEKGLLVPKAGKYKLKGTRKLVELESIERGIKRAMNADNKA